MGYWIESPWQARTQLTITVQIIRLEDVLKAEALERHLRLRVYVTVFLSVLEESSADHRIQDFCKIHSNSNQNRWYASRGACGGLTGEIHKTRIENQIKTLIREIHRFTQEGLDPPFQKKLSQIY